MRRVWVLLASASLVAAWGCGNSYNFRMEQTLEAMHYLKRLNENLMPAATKGKFEELLIYIRPPKNLQPAKEFLLPLPEAGKFDLEASFLETQSSVDAQQPVGEAPKQVSLQKQSLHMLARVKRPKNPAAKKKAEPTNRGKFTTDVLALINAAYSPPTEPTLDKFKPTEKKKNVFKQHSFAVGGKNVQIYLYGAETDPYVVALIFEYPSSESLHSKIELCLESFAVGTKARNAFSGTIGPETPGEAPGAAPGAF